ncbi:BBP7 family outer membrane beta-barrel protein [Roseiconus nitratireducens]|uniref:BBP7 family outer membrane beta-barrel protein n=1 Tax=Roseiconus nitratireducens TaxID=2605748 RepID=A0A5M6DCH7_9BACT|nr:BBP7 family outer membrane beta-barrel protein [Roseiconus nitratireducens]KAA5543789.1 BBP7 family outer membrane beta-barrel protein [Roseiconus nitratireducens]
MPTLRKLSPLAAAFSAALTFGWSGALTATAQSASGYTDGPNSRTTQRSVVQQAARASWTPTRGSGTTSTSDADAGYQRAPQTKAVKNARVLRPNPQHRSAPARSTATGSKRTSAIAQAQYSVPAPPPIEGETIVEGDVIYEGAVVDGYGPTLAAPMGAPCGCDSPGCDSMGYCESDCGCSLCGEAPSGRAWRPAITLSLPQDGWVSFEALHMWQDGMDLPPLITTSPSGTSRANAGVLTRPGTRTLYGDGEVLDDTFSGGRLRFGFWLDRCHTWGLGGEYLELDEENERFSRTSTGTPILARPFFNTLTGNEDAELIAFPGVIGGTATVDVRSQLSGGGFYLRKLTNCDEGCRAWLFCGCNGHFCSRSEIRVGYRYLELDEGVSIREELVSSDSTSPGSFDITDSFTTLNQFNGLDLGWNYRVTRGYWTYDGLIRLAVGNTNQTVKINGNTTITDPNNPPAESFNEGFLAVNSNIGEYENDEFTVVPELNLTLGYQLTDHLKVNVGYTGIYWSNVVRPGQHIPTLLNPDLLPPDLEDPMGDARPLFALDTTDYWVHGITYGLEYRW